jgi:hypothetical protein
MLKLTEDLQVLAVLRAYGAVELIQIDNIWNGTSKQEVTGECTNLIMLKFELLLAQISELHGSKHHFACLMLLWHELSCELLNRGVLLSHIFVDLADGCDHVRIDDLIFLGSWDTSHAHTHTAHTWLSTHTHAWLATHTRLLQTIQCLLETLSQTVKTVKVTEELLWVLYQRENLLNGVGQV